MLLLQYLVDIGSSYHVVVVAKSEFGGGAMEGVAHLLIRSSRRLLQARELNHTVLGVSRKGAGALKRMIQEC